MGTSNGVAPSFMVGFKSKSPKRAMTLKNRNKLQKINVIAMPGYALGAQTVLYNTCSLTRIERDCLKQNKKRSV